jgi:hypothetical protein
MSVDIATIETQIIAVLGAITVDSLAIKTYDHEPPDLDRLPAITLYPPDLERAQPDQVDKAPMGTVGWTLSWKLRIYVKLENAKRAQDQLKAIVGDAIKAIDANPSLNSALFETRLVKAASANANLASGTPVMLYDCDLYGLYFV